MGHKTFIPTGFLLRSAPSPMPPLDAEPLGRMQWAPSALDTAYTLPSQDEFWVKIIL